MTERNSSRIILLSGTELKAWVDAQLVLEKQRQKTITKRLVESAKNSSARAFTKYSNVQN